MSDSSERTLDRIGALAGLAAVLLLFSLFMVLPALPGPDEPITAIAASAVDDGTALLLGSYLGALMAGALLVFGAAFAAALRRAEGPGGGWWVVALAGIAGTSVGIAGNAMAASFVRAVEHGVRGDALWVGYSAEHAFGTLVAVPLGVFLLGAGLGARATGMLPRWLAWGALAVAVALVVGAASIAGNELDGGPLGVPLWLGYLALLVWILATSVVLRRGRRVAVVPATRDGLTPA
jgi:hypothetical protein